MSATSAFPSSSKQRLNGVALASPISQCSSKAVTNSDKEHHVIIE